MSLFCLLGRHRPSQTSMKRAQDGGYRALCEACGVPIAREEPGRWRSAGAHQSQHRP